MGFLSLNDLLREDSQFITLLGTEELLAQVRQDIYKFQHPLTKVNIVHLQGAAVGNNPLKACTEAKHNLVKLALDRRPDMIGISGYRVNYCHPKPNGQKETGDLYQAQVSGMVVTPRVNSN